MTVSDEMVVRALAAYWGPPGGREWHPKERAVMRAALTAALSDGWQGFATVPRDQEVEVRGIWKLRGDGFVFTHWRPVQSPASPAGEDDFCIACNVALKDGDLVHHDASGGLIHAACCGPERESYTGADGDPLKEGEPIPQPWEYSKSSSELPR
jgi:hypothetical protein